MGKFDECIETYEAAMTKLGIKIDKKLLRGVAKACGPSIYRNDASTVSSGDPKELERVRKNFLIKKLGLKDTPKLDEAIKEVVGQFGKGNRKKYRAIFYYLLVKKFRKSGMFK